MKIFLDTADPRQIAHWLSTGLVDGATTNPTILKKAGIGDIEAAAREIAQLLGDKPLSVEVTTDDAQQMIVEARKLAAIAPNIAVKIPIETSEGRNCLDVIHHLETKEDIRVNTTAILSFGQAILAAKAGATYVSIFWGRIADEGHDPAPVVASVAEWLEHWDYPSEIIVGSMRGAYDLQGAAQAGGHILTIPPDLLEKWADHKYSRATVKQFVADASAARAGAVRPA